MKRLFAQFQSDVRGVTAVEYAIVAGGIAVAIVVAVSNIGTSVVAMFQSAAAF